MLTLSWKYSWPSIAAAISLAFFVHARPLSREQRMLRMISAADQYQLVIYRLEILHMRLYRCANGIALLGGVALCISLRWPTRPNVLASLFLFLGYFIMLGMSG
jgi:hypothetical protein